MEQPNNPPAFPTVHREYDNHEERLWNEDGMTLRDYFAIKALPYTLAMFGGGLATWENNYTKAVNRAYWIADAMLAEREKEINR